MSDEPGGGGPPESLVQDEFSTEDAEHEPVFAALLAELAAGPAPAAWTLMQQTVGRYEVIGGLGRGGMGEVYRARDPELDRDVALKVLQPGGGNDLLEEARAAARLASPFIAGVYDVLTHEGQTVVAMELVEGPSVSALLHDRRVSGAEALHIAHGVAVALAVAHGAGIVHRDVKPGNILLRPDGHPLLVDFGLAVAEGDEEGPQGGTPRYAAPEQARGEAPSPSADVYAYGVTLKELLEGCDDPPALLRKLAEHCTREDPADRPPDGAALLDQLTPRSRSAGWAVVAAIVLIAVASGIPGLMSSIGPARPPSIESIPTVSEDRKVQRSFVLAIQAFYAGDREAAARALGPVLQADTADPLPWLLAAHLPPPPASDRPSPEAKLEALAAAGGERARLAAFATKALALKPWAPGQQVPKEKAAALTAQARELVAASPDAWLEHVVIVLSLPKTSDQHVRLELLDELERRDDGPPILALARAWALQHLQRDDESRAVLERAIAQHPGNDALVLNLAPLLLTGDPATAIARLEPLAARRPDDGVLRFSLAEAHLLAGDDAWQGILEDIRRGGFDPFLVGRGTLLFSEAVSARGRPDLADALRRDALQRLQALDAVEQTAGGYRRVLDEAIERGDAQVLGHWLKQGRAFASATPGDGPLALRRLRTTLSIGELHETIAAGDHDGARLRLDAIRQLPADTFGPDVTRARVLTSLGAQVAAAEGRRAQALELLDEATAGASAFDLQHPPPSLLGGDLKRRLGMKREAAASYRTVLKRTDACLATSLFWEVRCRRDLARALDALITLEPEKAAQWREARRRAQPLATGHQPP